MGGCTKRQKNGVAASSPTAKSDQPSALTAKPIRNGMLPSVRFSIGTLKHASMVQYLSERSSSRLRNTFNWRATSRTRDGNAQGRQTHQNTFADKTPEKVGVVAVRP